MSHNYFIKRSYTVEEITSFIKTEYFRLITDVETGERYLANSTGAPIGKISNDIQTINDIFNPHFFEVVAHDGHSASFLMLDNMKGQGWFNEEKFLTRETCRPTREEQEIINRMFQFETIGANYYSAQENKQKGTLTMNEKRMKKVADYTIKQLQTVLESKIITIKKDPKSGNLVFTNHLKQSVGMVAKGIKSIEDIYNPRFYKVILEDTNQEPFLLLDNYKREDGWNGFYLYSREEINNMFVFEEIEKDNPSEQLSAKKVEKVQSTIPRQQYNPSDYEPTSNSRTVEEPSNTSLAIVSVLSFLLPIGLFIGSGVLSWRWVDPSSFLGGIGFLIVFAIIFGIGQFLLTAILALFTSK